jgi:hypothetical protein
MATVIQDRIDQTRMIENRIARFEVAQQIDQRDPVVLRTRQRAHNEVEIDCGKPRPTIRSDHRDFIMRDQRADGKSEIFSRGSTRIPPQRRDGFGSSSLPLNLLSVFRKWIVRKATN